MSRIVNSGNSTEIGKETIVGCMLVDLDFASGHVYASDGFIEVVYAGHTYSPLGQFAGVELIEEQLDLIARPVKLTLSGVDAALLSPAMNEVYQNRSVTLYTALIQAGTGALVATPEVAWEGRMDYMEITLDQNVGTIMLNCEHRLRRAPMIARYTDSDQQQLHPGDTFFSNTAKIAGYQGVWGGNIVNYNAGGSPAAPPKTGGG